MKLRKTELTVYRVDLVCPKCDKGTMAPIGGQYLSIPPMQEHQCNECGHVERVRGASYPRIQYEAVGSPQVVGED